MSLSRPYKLPIVPPVTVRKGSDLDVPTNMEYDEVVFDYNTNRYYTRSQQEEIVRLRKELELKEKTRKEKLQNIIGYFYKRK